ncbi:YdcF family protein [Parendozoicomonas haliclonae]|uniref:DUF218 domain-containing protein n=1 Tax=Parendozoicomonas haliclonae TaxID=1960125 RepID=A0A1X7AN93_9GAMM|nr:YdcF family protein [Parendozoicomonas haliclonae]SMA49553.1 hypothetical protein EHSB41UT_03341 [Parendozoicomonas haliclonae]
MTISGGNLLKYLLQPPGLQLLLLVIALLCWFRYRQLAFSLVAVSCVSLYLLSTGVVANALMRGLERDIPIAQIMAGTDKAAMVVLGTGVLSNTPEYDNEPQPSALLTQRLRYAHKLAVDTSLPVLVTGGSRYGINEADVMATYLLNVGQSVQWREDQSWSTEQNAEHTAGLLKPEGIETVYLVSHAWHLRRACQLFIREGFNCIPAPTAFAGKPVRYSRVSAWLPDALELRKSQLALHEYMGMLWLTLKR